MMRVRAFTTILSQPFYKNSVFMMFATIARAGFGFVFWIIAARFYQMSDVGVATAMISSVALIVTISRLGLDQSILKYLATGNKSEIIGSSLYVTTGACLSIGVAMILAVNFFIPSLEIISDFWHVFLLFLVTSSVLSVATTTFIASRKAVFSFAQSLVGGTRILFLGLFVAANAIGIVVSELISSFVVLALSFYWLSKIGLRIGGLSREYLRDSLRFSSGNYVAMLLLALPGQLMPILVLGLSGADETASFYIVFMIFSLMLIVPTSVSTSLFVEGSHGLDLGDTSRKSFLLIVALLSPLVIVIHTSGDWLLSLVGTDYCQSGYELLRLMAVSTFFVGFFSLSLSVMKVRNDVRMIVIVSAILMTTLFISSYLWLGQYGLTGLGYSWIASYLIISIVCALLFRLKPYL